MYKKKTGRRGVQIATRCGQGAKSYRGGENSPSNTSFMKSFAGTGKIMQKNGVKEGERDPGGLCVKLDVRHSERETARGCV